MNRAKNLTFYQNAGAGGLGLGFGAQSQQRRRIQQLQQRQNTQRNGSSFQVMSLAAGAERAKLARHVHTQVQKPEMEAENLVRRLIQVGYDFSWVLNQMSGESATQNLRMVQFADTTSGGVVRACFLSGDPVWLLPVLHWALLDYSPLVATILTQSGFNLLASNDKDFVSVVWKLALEKFAYRPLITTNQFLGRGYVAHKLRFVFDIVNCCRSCHEDTTGSYQRSRNGNTGGSGPFLDLKDKEDITTTPAKAVSPNSPSPDTSLPIKAHVRRGTPEDSSPRAPSLKLMGLDQAEKGKIPSSLVEVGTGTHDSRSGDSQVEENSRLLAQILRAVHSIEKTQQTIMERFNNLEARLSRIEDDEEEGSEFAM